METNRFIEEAQKYIMTYDYHTHTVFSHGKGTIQDNVEMAAKLGLKGIAITDHGPGHLTYGIKREAVPKMREEVCAMSKKYPQIEVFLGVEANIVASGNCLDISQEEIQDYDFIIGGYHYGVKNGYCMANWMEHHLPSSQKTKKRLMAINTDMTIKALHCNNLKILTHPGDKGQFDIMAIAQACKETNTLMEISTWHRHLTLEELKLLKNTENLFVVSSDAHRPKRVGDYINGVARALEAGIEPERIVNIMKR